MLTTTLVETPVLPSTAPPLAIKRRPDVVKALPIWLTTTDVVIAALLSVAPPFASKWRPLVAVDGNEQDRLPAEFWREMVKAPTPVAATR